MCQNLQYHKQRDTFIGDLDISAELQRLVESSRNECLENSVLCFLLCGLHGRYKIPVRYFFTKGCTGEQLAGVTRHGKRHRWRKIDIISVPKEDLQNAEGLNSNTNKAQESTVTLQTLKR